MIIFQIQSNKMQNEQPSTRQQSFNIHDSFEQLCRKFETRTNLLTPWGEQNTSIKANSKIHKDEAILVIPYKYFLKPDMQEVAQKSFLLQYLSKLVSIKQQGNKIFTCIRMSPTISQQSKDEEFCCLVNLIQKKFMQTLIYKDEEVEKIHSHHVNILSRCYRDHPFYYLNQIKPFHEEIYDYLSSCNKSIKRLIERALNLVNKHNYPFSFKQFLDPMNKGEFYESYVKAFTVENIAWAALVMQTRQLAQSGLNPLLDLFKHSSRNNAQMYFNDHLKVVSLVATRDIHISEQIFISDGTKSMRDLFCNYGFYSEYSVCEIDIPIKTHLTQPFLKIKYKIDDEEKDLTNQMIHSWLDSQFKAFLANKKMYNLQELFDSCEVEMANKIFKKNNLQELLHVRPKINLHLYHVFASTMKILQVELDLMDKILANKKVLIELFSQRPKTNDDL